MGNFVCPRCHGSGKETIRVEPCDASNIKPCHPHYCLCKGAGYYFKNTNCSICGGKGYRDWLDVIRRPYLGEHNHAI